MVRVRIAHAAQYLDPIELKAGEAVAVGSADAEFPDWYWCQDQRGKEGWVHRSYLTTLDETATAIRAYSAKELSVQPGTEAEVHERLDGWLLVKLNDGLVGWVPEANVQQL